MEESLEIIHTVFHNDTNWAIELGHALHERCHILAERFDDVFARDGRVLDRVVKQGRRDGVDVHVQTREDYGHLDGMRDVRLAAPAPLVGMRVFREMIGSLDGLHVFGGQVRCSCLLQVGEALIGRLGSSISESMLMRSRCRLLDNIGIRHVARLPSGRCLNSKCTTMTY